jgi:hypothetical protein
MKKEEQRKLSHFMCFKCHEVGHLANGCPNQEKLKLKKEEERLKHVKGFKCRNWAHLTSMCSTKQLVKQQEQSQPKPQVKQATKPQEQIQVNHEDGGDLGMMKKKITRGGRARHPTLIQDAKIVSKNKKDKRDLAHIKYYKCGDMGYFALRCPTKLEKKAQTTHERQGKKKHNMSKEEKAQSKRNCYLCQERGRMANSCPLGNTPKPILINEDSMLRKDGDGTSLVAPNSFYAKHPAIHTKATPKYVAPNLRGPNLVWVPSKSG